MIQNRKLISRQPYDRQLNIRFNLSPIHKYLECSWGLKHFNFPDPITDFEFNDFTSPSV